MIINYAAEKGLKIDESPKEVIEYIGNIDSEDIDIEMTPEMLAIVSGGMKMRKMYNKWEKKSTSEDVACQPISQSFCSHRGFLFLWTHS